MYRHRGPVPLLVVSAGRPKPNRSSRCQGIRYGWQRRFRTEHQYYHQVDSALSSGRLGMSKRLVSLNAERAIKIELVPGLGGR
jgi:hypothetical protein